MYRLLVDRGVLQEMNDPKSYPAKIYRQIALKIFSLQLNLRLRTASRLAMAIG